jgi:hypothetical protein
MLYITAEIIHYQTADFVYLLLSASASLLPFITALSLPWTFSFSLALSPPCPSPQYAQKTRQDIFRKKR